METQNLRAFQWHWGLIAVALLVNGGCSTLKGDRFSHEDSKSGTVLKGVPFTLNRPVPLISRIPGDGDTPDRYVVKMGYEPDRSQRYTLQLDPAWFSNADFDMSYDVNGSLTDTSAKSSDQLAQVFTSVAKLAIAAGVFDKASSTSDVELLEGLAKTGKEYLRRTDAVVFDTLRGVERPVTSVDREAWDALMQRVTKIAERENVRKAFFYKSREEYDLLQTLLRRCRTSTQLEMEADAEYSARFAELDRKQETRALAREIDVARRELNQRQMERIIATLTAERGKLRAGEELNLYSGGGDALADNYRLKKLASLATLPQLGRLLADIGDLEHAEWQRRIVAWLNREIEARRYVLQMNAMQRKEKLTPNGATQQDVVLSDLLDRKAAVLGVADIRRRQLAIMVVLSRAPQAKDYDDLRAELVALEASAAAAESALKAKAPEAKSEEPMRAEIFYSSSQLADQSAEIQRRLAEKLGGKLGEKLPRYVVLLQPVQRHVAIAPGGSTKPATPGAAAVPEPAKIDMPPGEPPSAADPPPIRNGAPGPAAVPEGGAK